MIILDDAHAGENYIASMWTISISRSDDPKAYHSLVDLLSGDLPSFFVADLQDDQAAPDKRQTVELLSGPRLIEKASAIEAQLDALQAKTEPYYAWQEVKGHLAACNLFISWSEIVFRPWIPPTLTHEPFAAATQRVFMSATLGEAGELERLSGIHKIHRIPVPTGWEQQSTGRRLILVPDRSFAPPDYIPWLMKFLGSQKRNLILAPSGVALGAIEKEIQKAGLPHKIFHSADIEDSLEPFTSKAPAILALKGRYDGIDLPGDACRIILIYGLPASVNLQEEFLWSRLGLSSMLRDRIRTRLTQAAGRCTRNATDYAVVILVGPKLMDFVIKMDNQALFHPEFRAELQFGLDNSQLDDVGSLTDLATLLLEHRPEWQQADADIVQRRDASVLPKPAFVTVLREAATLEVAYSYDLWKASYSAALDNATKIADKLSGDELGAYRALWNYFCGCAAYSLYKETGKAAMKNDAAERFRRASQSIRAIPMFAKLAHEIDGKVGQSAPAIELDTLAAENIEKQLVELGFVGPKFDKAIETARRNLQTIEARPFERGLAVLGGLLGYRATKPPDNAAPDSFWELGNTYFALIEAKSDGKPTDPISVSHCRQASGHGKWLKALPFVPHDAAPTIIVISSKTKLDKTAIPHAEGLYYMSLDDARALFSDAVECVRVVRNNAANMDTADRIKFILDERLKRKLTHNEIARRLAGKM